MKRRARSLIAVFAILIGLLLYAGIVGLLAQRLAPMPFFIEVVYHLFFGLIWIFPVRALFRWVGRGEI